MSISNTPSRETVSSLKRASLMPLESVKRYTGGHVYIFDDVDRNAWNQQPGRRSDDLLHEDACDRMDSFFRQNTEYRVHNVRKTEVGYNQTRFLNWWKQELAGYSEDELIIVYFHGSAYGRGMNFTWRFRSLPSKVNAWRLFETTNASNSDCLFIMDCYVATRFLEIPRRIKGYTDYTIAGQLDQDEHGQLKHTNGYTVQLTEYLTLFRDNINGAFRNWHARKSLPELLHKNDQLTSNPLRVWASKTSKTSQISKTRKKRPVYRLCVEPDEVRANGTFEWIRVCIEDESKDNDHQASDDNGNSSQLRVDEYYIDEDEHNGEGDMRMGETSMTNDTDTLFVPGDSQPHASIEIKDEIDIDFEIIPSDYIIDLTTDADDIMQDEESMVPRYISQSVDLTGDDDDDDDDDDDVIMMSNTTPLV